MTAARSLMRRFVADQRGSVVARYFVFTAIWSLCMAGAVHVISPKLTTNLKAVSSAMRADAYR